MYTLFRLQKPLAIRQGSTFSLRTFFLNLSIRISYPQQFELILTRHTKMNQPLPHMHHIPLPVTSYHSRPDHCQ